MSIGGLLGGLAGAAIGGTPLSIAAGAGIGTLLEGKSGKQAIKNALIGGVAGAVAPGAVRAIYGSGIAGALRGGAQNIMGGFGLGAGAQAPAAQATLTNAGTPLYQQPAAMRNQLPPPPRGGGAFGGIFQNMDPMMKASLALSVAGAMEQPEGLPPLELDTLSDDDVARIRREAMTNLYVDPVTGARYDSPEARDAAIRAREIEGQSYATGGFVEGPGTETSDSIPAMIHQNGSPVQEARLSDGEFVMTGKAVRGAGDGDREAGAARMYELMRQFEQRA